MTTPNQSALQASIRGLTGTTLNYDGDWHGLFDYDNLPAGSFNERQIVWLNKQLCGDFDALPNVRAAYAADAGVTRWDDVTALSYISSGLGPNLISPSPTIELGAGWSEDPDNVTRYVREVELFSWLVFPGIVTPSTEYELTYRLTGWGGGSILPRLTDGGQGNAVAFDNQSSDGTYTSRATGNGLSVDLAFGASGGNGTVSVISLREVLVAASGFSSGFSSGFG